MSIGALYPPLTAFAAYSAGLGSTAHNLANVLTNNFKAGRVELQRTVEPVRRSGWRAAAAGQFRAFSALWAGPAASGEWQSGGAGGLCGGLQYRCGPGNGQPYRDLPYLSGQCPDGANGR